MNILQDRYISHFSNGFVRMSMQCKGTTKNGGQCKLTGTFENGYCHLHKNQSPITKPQHENRTPPQQPSEALHSCPDPQPEPLSGNPENTSHKKRCFQPEVVAALIVLFLVVAVVSRFKRKTV